MSPRNATLPAPRLLERDGEITQLSAALAEASEGRGRLVAIEGPAGTGKTALLEFAYRQALAEGADARLARGTELEGEFAFGGARQLLSVCRDGDLTGAAQVILPVLATADRASDPPPAFAVLNGLTALVAALASERTLVLLIDDAHWLDAPTVRWLDHLRARVAEMRLLIVVAVRPMAAQQLDHPLHRLLGDPRLQHRSLAPLSESAVAHLLEARLGHPPAPSLVVSCARATAGNAFAVCELIASLELDEIASLELDDGWSNAPDQLSPRVPSAIARSIRARLSRLEADAVGVARALAILGDGAPLHRVAALAGLPGRRAGLMADVLAGAELIASSQPLVFVHSLVRSAIEEDLGWGERSAQHAAAADLLAEEDADPEEVAAHLLRCDPIGDPSTVEGLRNAARLALSRGAPDTAATYLSRAHAEPPPADQRVAVLHELGRAELLARAPASLGHLESALARAGDPVTAARIGRDLFDGMSVSGRWSEALALVHELRDALGDSDPALALGLEMRHAFSLIEDGTGDDSLELSRIEALGHHQPGAGALLLLVALALALRSERCGEVAALVSAGLDGGRFLAEHTADSIFAVHGIDALVFVDALDAATRLAESLCDDARRRGLVLGAVAGATHRGLASLRAGRLTEAESDLREALASAIENELGFTLPFVVAYLAESLAEQGRLDEAVTVLSLVPEALPEVSNAAAATLLSARGAIGLAVGRHGPAVTDLRACGAHLGRMGATNPLVAPWRSTLARALPLPDRDEAEALVAEELRLARSAGQARGIGVALMAQARLAPGTATVSLLEEAVDVLVDSPAALERTKALTALGIALRRSGQTADGRRYLRQALDLASRCDATGLGAHITTELHIAGARPRGPWLTGARALTPSELRVARLAARGLSNPQIASELVITPKTVKHHLGAVYRKLEITRRAELDRAVLTAGDGLGPHQDAERGPADPSRFTTGGN